MENLISVIVPIYNVEKFLNRCINSITNQTYKNLEIILIDDGSTDNSGKICDEYKEKDSRVVVFHKENGGPSEARNLGIKKSTGNWIFFVDGDDYIDLNIIEDLYRNAIENNSDIAACGYVLKMFEEEKASYNKENYVCNSEEIFKRLLTNNDISSFIIDKLYKKELFNGIEFPIGNTRERIAVLYKLFDKANKISHINKAGYYYVQRNGSLSHSEFSSERLIGIKFIEEMVESLYIKYPNLTEYAEKYYIKELINYIKISYEQNVRKEYKNLINKLKEYIPRVLKNSQIKFGTKIKIILIAYCGCIKIFK